MKIILAYVIFVVVIIVLLIHINGTGNGMHTGKKPIIVRVLCRNYPQRPAEKYHTNSNWQSAGYIRWNDTMLFSAFLDTRTINGHKGVVRVFGIADSVAEYGPFHCQLWYKGEKNPLIRRAELSQIGGGHRIGDSYYIEYLFTCPGIYLKRLTPSHVSIVPSDCGRAGNLLPVHAPATPKLFRYFGICVPPSPLKHLTALNLIEWLESNRRFGISRVFYYSPPIQSDMKKVFDFYERDGFVKVTKMAPPLTVNNDDVTRLAAIIAMNDCMYRNMESFKYLMVLFPDEIVVPKLHRSYHELLEAVDDSVRFGFREPAKSYTFRNAIFWTHLVSRNENLRMFRHIFRSAPNTFLYQSRSFVSPKLCITVFENYCWMKMPFETGSWTIDVNEGLALKHHYLSCVNCKRKDIVFKDLSIFRFKNYLQLTVFDAIKNIFPHPYNRSIQESEVFIEVS
jgi:hypothetical protein